MTRIVWATEALHDVRRLERFLIGKDPAAARAIRKRLFDAPLRLIEGPRIGAPLDKFAPREVRRLIVGSYEMRYEVHTGVIEVMRIWHMREDRHDGP